MKKFLTIFLALLLLASVFPFAVSAHNGTNAGTINDFKGIIDTDAVRDPAYEAFGLKKQLNFHDPVTSTNPLGDGSGTIWWLFSEDYTKLNVFVEAHDTDFDDVPNDPRAFKDYRKAEGREDFNWDDYDIENGIYPYDNALDAARNNHVSRLYWHVDGIEIWIVPEGGNSGAYIDPGADEDAVNSAGGTYHYKADIHGNKYLAVRGKDLYEDECDPYFDVAVQIQRNSTGNGGTYYMEFCIDTSVYALDKVSGKKQTPVTIGEGSQIGICASMVDHCYTTATIWLTNVYALPAEERWALASTYMEDVTTSSSRKNLPAAQPYAVAGGKVAFDDCGAGNHVYDNGRITTQPTCAWDGVKTFTCKTCGDFYTEAILRDPDNHTFDFSFAQEYAKATKKADKDAASDKMKAVVLRIDQPATCTVDGWGLVKCKYCEYTQEMALPAVGHYDKTMPSVTSPDQTHDCQDVWSYQACKFAPTATKAGTVNVYGYSDPIENAATHGGNSIELIHAATAEHQPGSWVIKTNHKDDCAYTRSYVKICSVCGDICDEKTVVASAHDWSGEWVIDVPATPEQEGQRHKVCLNCAAEQSETYAYVCDHAYGEYTVQYDDCEHGKVLVRVCNLCTAEDYKVEREPGHDMQDVSAKAPTVTEIGWDAYQKCSRCDYTDGYHELPCLLPTLAIGELSGTAHQGKEITLPVLLQDNPGIVDVKFTVEYDETVLKLTGVTYTGLLGSSFEMTEISQPYHSGTIVRIVDSTGDDATESGTLVNLQFEVLGGGETSVGINFQEAYAKNGSAVPFDSANKDVATQAHNIVSFEAKEPSCTEAGWYAYETCSLCDYSTKEEISMLGHDEIQHDAQEPTCTAGGWEAYVTCSRCDYSTKKDLAPLGHTVGEWIIDAQPTEATNGHRHQECTVCGAVVAEESIPMLSWTNPFKDVKEKDWFYQSVKYATQNGLFNGTSDTTFEPNTPMNRAMFCRVIANLAGVDDENKVVVDAFTDISSGKWYTKAVKWASENGIVTGYPDGTFKPMRDISRQEMCLMLANYAKYLKIYDALLTKEDNGVVFADAKSIGNWANEAVNVMKNNGYIVGKKVNNVFYFQPTATATRAEVATIFRAFCIANPAVLEK